MKFRYSLFHSLLLGLALWSAALAKDSPGKANYPEARKGKQVDDFHGTKVADPYRWLEDPDSPESRRWIEAENKITFKFLDAIPQRSAIKARLKELWDYERYGVPFKEQARYFFSRNSGLQNQNVIYTTDNFAKSPRELIDPNSLSKDGTVALGGSAVSDDAKLLAYGLATAGSDWQQWKVCDVATGKDRPDALDWIKFSGASWMKDGSGFFYSRYDEPKDENKLRAQVYNQKLFFHKLGTAQAQDKLIYERPDHKDWLFSGEVTDDGHYLGHRRESGNRSEKSYFLQDLTTPDAKVVELLPNGDAAYSFIGNEHGTFWFRTDLNAPLGRIIAIDTTQAAAGQA